MPDPRAVNTGPVPEWPDTLPNPQADDFTVRGPPRAEVAELLFGPTRLNVRARTAPMEFGFNVIFTPEQLDIFEAFYREALEHFDGEFYARWLGGGRVLAFSRSYQLSPIGTGWSLTGAVITTRFDFTLCHDFIESVFGNIYQADLGAVDHYQADLTAVDTYRDDFPLQLIADNEC